VYTIASSNIIEQRLTNVLSTKALEYRAEESNAEGILDERIEYAKIR